MNSLLNLTKAENYHLMNPAIHIVKKKISKDSRHSPQNVATTDIQTKAIVTFIGQILRSYLLFILNVVRNSL